MYSNDDKNAIRNYIGQIRSLCDKVMEKLDEDDTSEPSNQKPWSDRFADEDITENVLNEETGYGEDGETEVFDELQKNAEESLELNSGTSSLEKPSPVYLVRKRTGEKILVNRNIFKLGKEEGYVDYCIKDNPTVSRNHADIVKKPDGYYIVDKGSLNHTFVNGKKLVGDEYRLLEDECLIQLADELFEWHN
jgi:hypothetical protein